MKTILVLFLSCITIEVWSQDSNTVKAPCDVLLHKSYQELYDEADAIMEGTPTMYYRAKQDVSYDILSVGNYKEGWEGLKLTQKSNKYWFNFLPDSSYVFLIYTRYSDPIFNPCVLFGEKDKMKGILDHAKTRCGELGPPPNPAPCEKTTQPVCGCDGKNYENPCEAWKAGITTYNKGACNK